MIEIGRIIRQWWIAYTVAQRVLICCCAVIYVALVVITGWAVASLLPILR